MIEFIWWKVKISSQRLSSYGGRSCRQFSQRLSSCGGRTASSQRLGSCGGRTVKGQALLLTLVGLHSVSLRGVKSMMKKKKKKMTNLSPGSEVLVTLNRLSETRSFLAADLG